MTGDGTSPSHRHITPRERRHEHLPRLPQLRLATPLKSRATRDCVGARTSAGALVPNGSRDANHAKPPREAVIGSRSGQKRPVGNPIEGLRKALTQAKRVLPLSESRSKGVGEHADLPNNGPDHAGNFIQHTFAEGQNLDIVHREFADLLRGSLDLRAGGRALHENEFTAIANQGSGQWEELPECADGTGGHLVQRSVESRILGPRADDGDIGKPQFVDLLIQPGDPAFHRLDQNEGDIRPCDRQHQPRQAGATADVADEARPQKGSNDHTVEDVAGPEAGEFQRSDETTFLALIGEVPGELPGKPDPVAKETCRCGGFLFEVRHCFT